MEEFDFLRSVTIGQYLPVGSAIHRLDPRAKLLAFLALIAAITFTGTYLGNLVLLLAVLLLLVLARVPLAYGLSGLKPALPFILVLALLQLIFSPVAAVSSPQLFALGPLTVTVESVRLVIVGIFRFVELYLLVSLLTLTTTTTEIAHGQESLLSPLARIGLPVHEFSLMMTIALRFVPLLADEAERLTRAQWSRGANFATGSRWRFIEQTRRMIPLLVPLFIAALQRAEELIVAMEARGYLGGRGRTRLVELHAAARDFAAVGLALAFAVVVLLLPFPF